MTKPYSDAPGQKLNPTPRDRKPRKRMYGTRIRQARERSGLSQDDMAELLGLSQNSYWKLENDETRLTVETMEEIAGILKMDASDFLQEDYAKYRTVLSRLVTINQLRMA